MGKLEVINPSISEGSHPIALDGGRHACCCGLCELEILSSQASNILSENDQSDLNFRVRLENATEAELPWGHPLGRGRARCEM
jgi:hypothetical protein